MYLCEDFYITPDYGVLQGRSGTRSYCGHGLVSWRSHLQNSADLTM